MSASKGKPKPPTRTLMEQETAQFSLRVEVTDDEMECYVTLLPLQGSAALPPDDLVLLLKKAGVSVGVDNDAVVALCRQANEGRPQEYIVAARGIPPEPGADGWIEFFVRISSNQICLQEDDEGTVDLRSLNFFANVEPGRQIGRIHPPENGPAGSAVTGLPVAPVPGKKLSIRCGAGVHLEEEGALLVADAPGRVLYEGETVSVSEEYSVNGDVDFNVGNIDFRGVVDVSGDVLDDFHVTGEKGITIGGSIGACRIESSGNIVLGSMSGKGKGFVRCGGNLVARYLSDVHVECAGNVIVANQIRNSVVKSAGFILVENGAVSGGECVALAGIEAKDLGSTLGVRTRLTSGVYFPEADRLAFLRERVHAVQEQVHRIQAALGPLSNRRAAGQVLAEGILKRIDILTERLQELNQEKEELNGELAAFQHQEHATTNPKINVRDWLGEGVTISLGDTTEEIRIEMQGPLSIIENTRDGGLRFLDMSPLTLKAADMEQRIEEEEEEDRNEKKGSRAGGAAQAPAAGTARSSG